MLGTSEGQHPIDQCVVLSCHHGSGGPRARLHWRRRPCELKLQYYSVTTGCFVRELVNSDDVTGFRPHWPASTALNGGLSRSSKRAASQRRQHRSLLNPHRRRQASSGPATMMTADDGIAAPIAWSTAVRGRVGGSDEQRAPGLAEVCMMHSMIRVAILTPRSTSLTLVPPVAVVINIIFFMNQRRHRHRYPRQTGQQHHHRLHHRASSDHVHTRHAAAAAHCHCCTGRGIMTV